MLNLDGIFLFEIWNLLHNSSKIFENLKMGSIDHENSVGKLEKVNKIKILMNKIIISRINLVMSFKPSFKMIKNLSQSQK